MTGSGPRPRPRGRLDRTTLRSDLIAGVTVAAIAIPEGLGYAKIVGLPIETGLYCSLLPPLLFALLGSSRQLIVGADSATAALVAAGAGAVAALGTPEYAGAIALLTLLTAGVLVVIALAGLDFLADLISQPVLAGFLSGVGLSLMIGKLPGILGLDVSGSSWERLQGVAGHLGEAHLASTLLGFATVAILLLAEARLPKLPAALLALGSVSVAGMLAHVDEHGVAMVGAIPAGLPSVSLPTLTGQWLTLVPAAASIALVILAQSAAVSRSFALQRDYPVSIRRDLLGLAAANAGASLTHGFAINGSPPRTAAGDEAGARSQWVNVAQAVTVGAVLLFLTGLFAHIPAPVLDGVVFAIGVRLLKIATLRDVRRARTSEFVVALLAAAAVAFVGVEEGILLAITLSLIDRLRRQYRPHEDVLVADGTVAPRLQTRMEIRQNQPPDLLVYRFDAALFFENATWFGERVRALLAEAKTPVRVLVLDAAAIDDIDYTGAHTLGEIAGELRARGGVLVVTELNEGASAMLDATGVARDLVIEPRLEHAVQIRPPA